MLETEWRGLLVVSPAKTAELLKILFGMCTWVGTRKHLVDWGAHWCHLANMIELSMCSCNAACCQITLMMMMMMRGFVERVINSPQTRC